MSKFSLHVKLNWLRNILALERKKKLAFELQNSDKSNTILIKFQLVNLNFKYI